MKVALAYQGTRIVENELRIVFHSDVWKKATLQTAIKSQSSSRREQCVKERGNSSQLFAGVSLVVQHPFFTVEFPVFLTVFTVERRLFAGRG